jgi:anti-sigma-K factor RskA
VKTEERHAQLELCIPYVFGRLNPGNRKQFEAHLETGCEQCKRELSELYEATALLPLLLKQEAPPSGLRQRLLSRLSTKRVEQPRGVKPTPTPTPTPTSTPTHQRETVEAPATKAPPHSWYLYASMVMGALLIVGLLLFLNDQLRTTSELEKKLNDLQVQVQQKQDILGVLQAQRVEMLLLVSAEAGSEASGRIFWEPEKRRAVLQVINLPAQPADKQYQLWLMKDKKYFRVSEFDVNTEKANVFAVMTLPVGEKKEIEEFAITLEPRGGSTQPSGVIQLRGTTK